MTDSPSNPTTLTSPVVFFIFNRPETTKRVFDEIRQARPATLFVIADGPRPEQPTDIERCQAARAIVENPDWSCKLITHYAASNLGCGQRIISGLDWVFTQVEQAIILEDDCLPDPSFFRFCDSLLNHYQQDSRVMHVSGHNRLMQWRSQQSRYFATYLYGSPWGWGTWRRAWQHFCKDQDQWRSLAHQANVAELMGTQALLDSFLHPFKNYPMSQLANEWGFIWTLSKLLQGGVSILPSKNLVSNIGIGSGATHTKGGNALLFQDTPRYALAFPLHHPTDLAVDYDYEQQHLLWYQGKSDPSLLLPLVHHLMAQKRMIHALIVLEKILKDSAETAKYLALKQKIMQQLRP
ncbi:MAG: glycosyltransferase family 2 protein [Cyanobacteria bacterium P01_H01_bin.15]